MLRFFERSEVCDIIIDPPLVDDDLQNLKRLLNNKYCSWNIEFGRIYNIDVDMLKLLHKNIVQEKKPIRIITHKYKLNRYLYNLGFKTHFISLIQEDIVDFKNVEVILIGGSANSSEKIIQLISNIDLGDLSLVIVQHVGLDGVEIFDEVLQKHTKYNISYVKDNQKIEKSHIYLAMKDKHLKIKDSRFCLSEEANYNYARPSISLSYESFSNHYKEKLLVIQECGYASDGVDKLNLLKQNNTKIIIQDPAECEATSMPEKALHVEAHDYMLDLQNIMYLLKLISIKDENKLLEYLKDIMLKKYGYDFRLYALDMFKRRIELFMLKHNLKSLKDTVGIILFNRSAFKGFFLELSINVTKFFREIESLSSMSNFFSTHYKNATSLKVWSAGCSSGEEPYSIAMLLDMLNLFERSTIYATDFNEIVLKEAKNAIYAKDKYTQAQNDFLALGFNAKLDDYVEHYDDFVVINEKIRKKVLFFQHNLATDSSFNEFDIIICKNVIIYFDDDLQEKVFELFYKSLKYGGHLILGNSENISLKYNEKFKQCSQNSKIFKKVA